MQCCNPKILQVTGYDFTDTVQFIPCGKCYGCQCNSRAETALRMRREMEDPYNCVAYFLTLTYSDKWLPTCLPETYRDRVLEYMRVLPVGERRYDFSLLVRQHLVDFLAQMRDAFRVRYCNGKVNNHAKVVVSEPNTLLRYYCTGEYGDISHRCHFHCIVCFPRKIHFFDVLHLVLDCWYYGNVEVDHIDTIGAVNYVAKHEVKECEGCEFQKNFAPIFSIRSNYGGGIGRIMKNDEVMKEKYLKSIYTGDKSDLYYTNISQNVVYKVSIPRYLKQSWHPQRFTDNELVTAQEQSIKNLIKFCFETLEKNFYLSPETLELIRKVKFEFSNIKSIYELNHSLDVRNYSNLRVIAGMLKKISAPLIFEDMKRREVYLNKHIARKLKQIAYNKHKDT